MKPLRYLLKNMIRLCLKLIGPRMTMWSLYCIFAEVQWDYKQAENETQVTAWGKVCRHLSGASDVCEELEVTEGWGLRSHPFVVDEAVKITTSVDAVTIVQGPTTCRKWVKTTTKFPLLKG